MIGEDSDAATFYELLEEQNLSRDGIIQSQNRVTTIKHRILSGHQHMLRVDSEISTPINQDEKEGLFQKIKELAKDCHVIIFEDYDKGILDSELIEKVISYARKLGIPTIVDPKKRNFLAYKGATLFKPNLKELKEGLKLDFDNKDDKEIKNAVKILKDELQLAHAMITMSERGVYIDSDTEQHHIPAHHRSIADVSGAGDTVVSVAALCLALHLQPKLIASLSNLAGGLVCEHLGVVSINQMKLLEEAKKNMLFEACI